MENNISIQSQTRFGLAQSLQVLARAVKAPMEWLRAYYSSVCGKSLTMSQTLLLVNTQMAFVVSAFPVGMPLAARLAGCVWLVASLRKCRESI